MNVTDDVAMNIRNERRGEVDRNPFIDCAGCEESHLYQDYWEERYVEGKDWNPAQVSWFCDECMAKFYEWYYTQKKTESHKTLTEW
jgi:hypothetical protein